MTRDFLITGNAGQGKTTLAANLAQALSSFLKGVVVFDGDQRSPTLGFHFGVPLVFRTVQDAVRGVPIEECLYEHPGGLRLMLGSIMGPATEHPKQLIDVLNEHSDVLFVDVPTRDSRFYQTNIPAIVVTTPDFPSIMNVHKLCRTIPNILGIVLNRVHHDSFELSAGNVQDLLGLPVLAMIPEDPLMREALKLGHPLVESHPEADTSTILRELAANLMNYYVFGKAHARS